MSITDLRNALDYITDHPQEWDQSAWFCGTTACLAGHIAMRAGWEPVPFEDWDEGGAELVSLGNLVDHVPTVASEIVGILPEEGDVLWNSINSLAVLEGLVRRLEADRAIYGTMSQPIHAWDHCWTNSRSRIMIAISRRTSFVRIGPNYRTQDWDSRAEALEYARATVAGMDLTEWHNGNRLAAA